jgi:hypothetical protein
MVEVRDGESWCKDTLRPALFCGRHRGHSGLSVANYENQAAIGVWYKPRQLTGQYTKEGLFFCDSLLEPLDLLVL